MEAKATMDVLRTVDSIVTDEEVINYVVNGLDAPSNLS